MNVQSLQKRPQLLDSGAPDAALGVVAPPPAFDAGRHVEHRGLIEYLRTFNYHKGAILMSALLGLMIGVILSASQSKMYQAYASMEFQEINDKLLNKEELDGIGQTTGESYIQTQIRILQSRSLLERVVNAMNMTDRTDLPANRNLLDRWREFAGFDVKPVFPQQRSRSVEYYVGQFMLSMRVRPLEQTRMVELLCEYESPEIAAEFVNRLAEAYIDQNLEGRSKTTHRTEVLLGSEINDLKAKLERSEADLQIYSRTTGLLFVNEKDNVAEEKLRMVQAELARAESEAISRQSQFERAGSSSPSALPEVLDNGPIREYQLKLTELKRNRAELEATLTPENSKVIKVQAQITELENGIERERTNVIKRIKNEYEAAKRRQDLLTSSYSAQVESVRQKAGEIAHYNTLKFEVDTNRQLYESMLQKVKEYGIASTLQASNVRIIDSALVPRIPLRPNPVLAGTLGLFAGLIFGVLFVLIAERVNETFQTPGEVAAFLRVNELGAIPQIATKNKTRRRLQTLTSGINEISALSKLTEDVSPDTFRSTLLSINFILQSRSGPQTLVISSPGPGEGKTTTVRNLGVALADSRRRVLLIDADLRGPRLGRTFGLGNSAGLTELLSGIDPLDQHMPRFVGEETNYPGLFVLSAGLPRDPNALYSPRLAEVLTACKRHFDIILIDTPPLLEFPDARLVAGLTDALILVVKASRTTRQQAIQVKERLLQDGIPLLGIVLNGWDTKRRAYGDSYARA